MLLQPTDNIILASLFSFVSVSGKTKLNCGEICVASGTVTVTVHNFSQKIAAGV